MVKAMSSQKRAADQQRPRRGDLVEVRSQEEILATLDADGKLDGLPFMPEMAQFCNRTFRVHRRAERIFLDRRNYVVRIKRTVFLEDVRCDGLAHGGCEMGCLLFWKEAWLKPAQSECQSIISDREKKGLPADKRFCPALNQEGKYCCQATEQIRASVPLPWWDARQYVRDLASGDLTFRQLLGMLPLMTVRKLRSWCGCVSTNTIANGPRQTATESLRLQPGELVEVKSREEIEATLDSLGRNRGLGFGGEMLNFCGRRFKVAKRVERLIMEWTGELRAVSDTVALDGVYCLGTAMRGCPRRCYHLWREIWLKRVD
jgi:hypothetical protein